MSAEQQQKATLNLVWVITVLMSIVGFFTYRTFDKIDAIQIKLDNHIVTYTAEKVELMVRIGIAEREVERYRTEREQRAHYRDQYRNEQPQTP